MRPDPSPVVGELTQPSFSLDWAYAYGQPNTTLQFKTYPEDFRVTEQLRIDPEEGEHVYLYLQKRGLNTQDVAEKLAKYCSVQKMAVSFSGMKDRQAVTQQWFSIQLPGREEPDWHDFETEDLTILKSSRCLRKLRRGAHDFNHFSILLRGVGSAEVELRQRLEKIKAQGVPNYFGLQRFGYNGNNLQGAQRLLVEKKKPRQGYLKGIYLSAARSFLFNEIVSRRLNMMDSRELDLLQQASGPLWGRGRNTPDEAAIEIEGQMAEEYSQWCDGLEHAGLNQERRPLWLRPIGLLFDFEMSPNDTSKNDGCLKIEFALPPGSYATSVLRELCKLNEPAYSPATA